MSTKKIPSDTIFEEGLRPTSFQTYIGQQKTKENLRIIIEAAKKREEPIEHIMFYGPPGLGKTTLANVIGKEMNANIKSTSGPAIEKVGDLASILTNLEEGDVLFIDEVHRLNRSIEEVLYPAMEDFKLDIIIGKGPSAKTIEINLPKFTLISATTRIGLLSAPFRNRFGAIYRLDFYSQEEMRDIIRRSANILNIDIDETSIGLLSASSRFTPRISNRLLKRVRDFAEVKGNGKVTTDITEKTLELLGVDSMGLEPNDRKLLNIIADHFRGKPVGIQALSAAANEEIDTITEVYEPYLMRIGFIIRTPQGRFLTDRAYEHLEKYKFVDEI